MPTTTATTQQFTARLDWWVALGAAGAALGCIAGFVLAILMPLELGQRLFLGGVCVVLILALVDTCLFVSYTLTAHELVIRTIARKVSISYRAITEIKPTGLRALITTWHHKRFALSTKALTLSLSGERWGTISVSPSNYDDFLAQLLRRIEHERSTRASRAHHR